MTISSDRIKCETCGHTGSASATAAWHPFRHPLKLLGESPANVFSKKPQQDETLPETGTPVVQSSMPFDPVLRQALIDKGILTPEDLREAEVKIRAVTGIMMGMIPPQEGEAHVPSTG